MRCPSVLNRYLNKRTKVVVETHNSLALSVIIVNEMMEHEYGGQMKRDESEREGGAKIERERKRMC